MVTISIWNLVVWMSFWALWGFGLCWILVRRGVRHQLRKAEERVAFYSEAATQSERRRVSTATQVTALCAACDAAMNCANIERGRAAVLQERLDGARAELAAERGEKTPGEPNCGGTPQDLARMLERTDFIDPDIEVPVVAEGEGAPAVVEMAVAAG